MRIYSFVEYYPNAYKAYYDTQFGDLVSKGHDLHVFAIGRLDSVVDGKVIDSGLGERRRYFLPDDLRSLGEQGRSWASQHYDDITTLNQRLLDQVISEG